MNQHDFDLLPSHEKSLMNIISSIKGECSMDAFGMEKACSIRFDHRNYPQLKAISNLSGNSLNIVANEVVRIGLGLIIENMDGADASMLSAESEKIFNEWMSDTMKEDR